MNLEIVSFETAKLAAQKGYEDESDMYYDENGNLKFDPDYDLTNRQATKPKIWYHAPYQAEVQGWLRDGYNIHVLPNYQQTLADPPIQSWYLLISGGYFHVDNGEKNQGFKSYEEALEKGLFIALNTL